MLTENKSVVVQVRVKEGTRGYENIWGNGSALHLDCDGGFMIHIKTQTAYFKYSLLYVNHILIKLPFLK